MSGLPMGGDRETTYSTMEISEEFVSDLYKTYSVSYLDTSLSDMEGDD